MRKFKTYPCDQEGDEEQEGNLGVSPRGRVRFQSNAMLAMEQCVSGWVGRQGWPGYRPGYWVRADCDGVLIVTSWGRFNLGAVLVCTHICRDFGTCRGELRRDMYFGGFEPRKRSFSIEYVTISERKSAKLQAFEVNSPSCQGVNGERYDDADPA